MLSNRSPVQGAGGGIPRDKIGDVRRLAQGSKSRMLVSFRVFRTKRRYFKLSNYKIKYPSK